MDGRRPCPACYTHRERVVYRPALDPSAAVVRVCRWCNGRGWATPEAYVAWHTHRRERRSFEERVREG